MRRRWALDAQFVKAVHTALKRLRREEDLGRHPLVELTVAAERRRQKGWPETDLGRAASLQDVMGEARHRLAEVDPDSAALLERRFWQGESVVQLAHERNVAESTLYAHQERAIHALARTLWEMEQEAAERWADRRRALLRHVPPPTYTRLFGFDEVFARLQGLLTDPAGPRFISIEGLGGLGKTALAHRLTTWAAGEVRFADIAWIVARRRQFLTWQGILDGDSPHPTLSFEMLLDEMADQLIGPDAASFPPEKKRRRLERLLEREPYLIVVDNLETAVAPRELIPRLWQFSGPSRFLFTSRHSLGQHPGVFCLTLNELSEADSIALMRHEARARGVTALSEAEDDTLRRIYQVTGGNPLAIKLVVGQARYLPVERVLDRLRSGAGRQYEDLYRFIYWRSWEMLDEDARRVLLAMPALAPSGAYWENLQAATGLSDHRLDAAIERLVEMSLLQVAGGSETRYTIHQLTYTFILSELLGKWGRADGDG